MAPILRRRFLGDLGRLKSAAGDRYQITSQPGKVVVFDLLYGTFATDDRFNGVIKVIGDNVVGLLSLSLRVIVGAQFIVPTWEDDSRSWAQ